MNTDAWIDMLARGAGPAQPQPVARLLGQALLPGLAASIALALLILGPIPAWMLAEPAPWLKWGYALLLGAAAAWAVARLARPAARIGGPVVALLMVLGLAAVVGLASLLSQPELGWPTALRGHSWRTCTLSVLGMSVPALLLLSRALRRLAPTRLRLAGLAVGLLSGCIGAFGYAVACMERAPSFIALWYTLGILAAGALGAWLGPRLLRW